MPAHIPGISYYTYFEIADAFVPFARTEREQYSFDFVGHVAREFEGIAFTAAKDPVFAKNRRDNVQNAQRQELRGCAGAVGSPWSISDGAKVRLILPVAVNQPDEPAKIIFDAQDVVVAFVAPR